MRTTEIERLHEALQEHAREIRKLKKWRSQVSAGDRIRSTVIIGSVPPGGGGTGIVTTAPVWYLWENQSGAIRQQGTVCVQNGDRTFGVTTTPDDPLVIGVLDEDDDVAIGADGFVRHVGFQPVVFTQGVVVAGHYLRTSTTAARAEDAGTVPTPGTFGWALTASAGGASSVAAFIDTGLRHPAGGAGVSGTANLYLNGVLFCSSNDLNLIEGPGVWISGTCAAIGSWEIGAYPAAPSGGGLSGVDFAANGAVLCFGAGLDLQEEAGVWISGACAGGEATIHVGAYALPAPTSISGVDFHADGGPFCWGHVLDLIPQAEVWISASCVAGEARYTMGTYPAAAPPTSVSGIAFEKDGAGFCWGNVLDLIEGAGVWISGACVGGEAQYVFGAYASLILDEQATQVIAAGTTISVTDGKPLTPFTTSGNVTSTAAPFIAAGRNGQLVILRNDNGSGTLTLSDTNIGAGGSLLRLSASTVTMAAGSSMGLEYSTIQGAWVEQWYLALVSVTPAILTFTINIGAGAANAQNAEVASGGTHPATMAWTYTGVPSEGTVDVSAGGDPAADYPATILTPFTALVAPAFNKGTSVGTVRTFTPTIKVNGVWKTTPTATVTYINRRYMGPSAETAALTTAQVLGLDGAGGTSDLSTIRTGTFSVTIAGGTYLWFAYRAALGAAIYLALNVAGETSEIAEIIEKQTALAHQNDSLFTEDFRTWRATTPAVGAVTAIVSTTQPNNRFYMGPAANGTDDISNAEVLALDDTPDGHSGVYSSQARTWTPFTTEAGEYLWYCHPSRVADLASIKDVSTGFGIAGSYRNNMTHTNQYGYQETYRCWRSDNPNIFPIGSYPTGGSVVVT
jgi:hypothetical protein